MLQVLRRLTALAEFLLHLPRRPLRFLSNAIAFNPKLGPLRHVATAGILYVVFALLLVYVVAPIRGLK